MSNIPLIFPCHLSIEQKSTLIEIASTLTTHLPDYISICDELKLLPKDLMFFCIDDITSSIYHYQRKDFKFISYNLKVASIKLSFIADYSSNLTSIASANLDSILSHSISEIESIISDCYELWLDSKS